MKELMCKNDAPRRRDAGKGQESLARNAYDDGAPTDTTIKPSSRETSANVVSTFVRCLQDA